MIAKRLITVVLSLLAAVVPAISHAEPMADYYQQRANELKDLKWGMFICWSLSTFSGTEWTDPAGKDPSFFQATDVDTDQWARTAKEAGMGYILFLTKHHDGFCLWDTKTTEFKSTNSPLKKDVLAELRKSCDKYGIKLALYFSEGDWNWPGGAYKNHSSVNPEVKKAQLKELLTQYGEIEYIWFDHAIGTGGLSHDETTAFCHEVQPHTLIGYNHGVCSGEIRIGERGKPSALNDASGSGLNRKAASYKKYLVAEFTYPILPAHWGGANWFYSLPKYDNICTDAQKIYRDYLGAVKYGNIFSIDVGPDYNGKLRDIDVKTLQQVGRMIKEGADMPEPIDVKSSLSYNKPVKASSNWDSETYSVASAFDGDLVSRWGAAPRARSGWIEVDLTKPTEVKKVVICETFSRTREFKIEVRSSETEEWETVYQGTYIAMQEFTIPFVKPVTARFIRLNILYATDVPTIEEFMVF